MQIGTKISIAIIVTWFIGLGLGYVIGKYPIKASEKKPVVSDIAFGFDSPFWSQFVVFTMLADKDESITEPVKLVLKEVAKDVIFKQTTGFDILSGLPEALKMNREDCYGFLFIQGEH